MRSLRLAILPLLVATSLAAQAPAPKDAPPSPAAMAAQAKTLFVDLAGLGSTRQRFGLEPLFLGRWAIGLIGTHSGTDSPPVHYNSQCPGCYAAPESSSNHNDWSLDLAVRYYPAAFSIDGARQRLIVYLAAFVGYQWRTITQWSYGYPLDGKRTRIWGVEPGLEIGARLKPLDPLFVDVGGWFKLVTMDDPTQRLRPGQLDARLVVAVGIGW